MLQVTAYNPITPIQPVPTVKSSVQEAFIPNKEKKDTFEFSKEAENASRNLTRNQSTSRSNDSEQINAEFESKKADIQQIEERQLEKKSEAKTEYNQHESVKIQKPQSNQTSGSILNLVG